MIKMFCGWIALIYTAQANDTMMENEVGLMDLQLSYITNAVDIANWKNQLFALRSTADKRPFRLFFENAYKEMIDDAKESKEEYLTCVHGFLLKDERLYKDLLKPDFILNLMTELTENNKRFKVKKRENIS